MDTHSQDGAPCLGTVCPCQGTVWPVSGGTNKQEIVDSDLPHSYNIGLVQPAMMSFHNQDRQWVVIPSLHSEPALSPAKALSHWADPSRSFPLSEPQP